MASTDINVIIENLTELLTNTVNMTSVYYDIFLNPEPMDVEFKQFASDGTYKTVSIPNRAKDRSIALTGSGSPEEVVSANVGTCYVDDENQNVYFKMIGTGNTGWIIVLTQEGAEQYIRSYLTENKFTTEADLARYLTNNQYVTSSTLSSALNQYKPITQAYSPAQTSGTVVLEDNSCYAFTATGDISFVLPSASTLSNNQLHKILVQIKLNNAVTIDLGTSTYFDNITPTFTTGSYNIMYEYDIPTSTWVCGVMKKGS